MFLILFLRHYSKLDALVKISSTIAVNFSNIIFKSLKKSSSSLNLINPAKSNILNEKKICVSNHLEIGH